MSNLSQFSHGLSNWMVSWPNIAIRFVLVIQWHDEGVVPVGLCGVCYFFDRYRVNSAATMAQYAGEDLVSANITIVIAVRNGKKFVILKIVYALNMFVFETVLVSVTRGGLSLVEWWMLKGFRVLFRHFWYIDGWVSGPDLMRPICKIGCILENSGKKAHNLFQIVCFLQQFGIVMGHKITLFEV